MMEKTLSIIKPDAVKRNITGQINNMIESKGLRIIAQKMVRLSRNMAELFYQEHSHRPFFGELVEYMISEPVVLQVLEGVNAVEEYRILMGATDPAKADAGTIRKEVGLSVGENSVHGSDSKASAEREIKFFFAEIELCARD